MKKAAKGELNYILSNPEGEDAQSVERHRQKLQQMYLQQEPNKIAVQELMKLTFAARRDFVVSTVTDEHGQQKARQISEIVAAYPFLHDSDEVSMVLIFVVI